MTTNARMQRSPCVSLTYCVPARESVRQFETLGIDIETCPACGGALRIIACIEDPAGIKTILTHLDSVTVTIAPSSS
jgi:hypothetical protein